MQILIAILLAILAIVLFSAKRFLSNETLERAANAGGIVAAIAALLVLAFYTASLPKNVPVTPTISSLLKDEYIGRIIEDTSLQPIANAKITLVLEGVPPIVYTDSEGIYRFRVSISSNISGTVRVDAQGYQVYTRNITLSPDIKTIEDIRLLANSP